MRVVFAFCMYVVASAAVFALVGWHEIMPDMAALRQRASGRGMARPWLVELGRICCYNKHIYIKEKKTLQVVSRSTKYYLTVLQFQSDENWASHRLCDTATRWWCPSWDPSGDGLPWSTFPYRRWLQHMCRPPRSSSWSLPYPRSSDHSVPSLY